MTTTTVEHEVWASPPDGGAPVLFLRLDGEDWQWAEKFAAFLEGRGFENVSVVTVYPD